MKFAREKLNRTYFDGRRREGGAKLLNWPTFHFLAVFVLI